MIRFWSKVDQSGGPDACWPWTRSRNAHGYGQFMISEKKRPVLAHRYVMIEMGVLSEGQYVLHHCDNPSCCNPLHLYAGTHADNMNDMNQRGRNGNVGRKLSADEITRRQATRKARREERISS